MESRQVPVSLGELVRSFRLRKNLTQRELASRAGISVRALRDVERGRVSSPRRSSVHRLALALELAQSDKQVLLTAVGPRVLRLDGGWPRVEVLGPLVVWRGGEPVRVGSALQRDLL